MAPFINFHTHCKNATDDIRILVLNPEEWRKNTYSEKELYTVGIHPWHSNDNNIDIQLEWLETALQNKNVIALGEAGLDRSIATPLQVQESTLKQQIKLAKRYAKPLVFHAVRSIADILHVCKQEKVRQPFIIHGFTGKPEAIQQLHKSEGYASFGAKIITNRSWDEALKKSYEMKNLFFETDEAEISVSNVYQKAAEVIGVEVVELKEQVYSYFCNIFGKIAKTAYAAK